MPSPSVPADLSGITFTQLEKKILSTIERHIQQHDIAPTIAEIANELAISSRGTVHRYVQSLIKKGALMRVGNGWRGLRLVARPPADAEPVAGVLRNVTAPDGDFPGAGFPSMLPTEHPDLQQLRIPLLGKIAAGVPIEALPDEQHLDLAVFLIGPDRYALRVSGDSMIDAGILDGDTVILRKTGSASTGDIVVALIDNQEATLKRLGKTCDGLTELIPENSTMPVMRYSSRRVSIQGVLVGQLRSY